MKMIAAMECQACNATGLYQGLLEREASAIACSQCNGTGCEIVEYEPFTERRKRNDIKQVFMGNEHVVNDNTVGGVSYEEWIDNPESIYEPENALRNYHCPKLYMHYCTAKVRGRYEGKLKLWKQCNTLLDPGQCVYNCSLYNEKGKCWEQFDDETKQLEA